MAKLPPNTQQSAVNAKPNPLKVVGSTGLRRAGGFISADFLPQLNGINGRRQLGEMASNDPVISAFLFAVTMLIRQVEWKVDPRDSHNREAVKAADEVRRILFEELATPWSDVIGSACTMFQYGFAPQEVTWKKADSGLLVPHMIDLRNQETVFRWEFDDTGSTMTPLLGHGNLRGMWQQDYLHPMVYIPLEKMLLQRTDTSLNNPEGKSILRGAYTTWMRKKAIEEAEGRALLRAAGLVVLRIPGNLMRADADEQEQATFAAYRSLADNLANDRQGAIVLPSDVIGDTTSSSASKQASLQYDIEYKMADGHRSADMSPVIERMDKRMAMTVLADFILLGQQSVGSFALSDNKTALFNAALTSWLNMMAGNINRHLIRRWWIMNELPPETMPTLVPGKVQSPSITELGAYIMQLSGSGAMLFPDDELENYLRTKAGMPLPSDDTLKARETLVTHMGSPPEAAGGKDFWDMGPSAEEQNQQVKPQPTPQPANNTPWAPKGS